MACGGYPTEGKPKEKGGEKMHTEIKKRYIAIAAIVILVVGAVAYFAIAAQTPTKTVQDVSGSEGSQAGNQPVIGAATPTPTSGQEIIDPWGRKVNSGNIIDAGIVQATTDAFKQPPELVRNGLLDIQVNFKNAQLTVKANKIPPEKMTIVRIKMFDEQGPIKFGKSQDSPDYREIIIGSNGEERGQIIPNEDLLHPITGQVKLEVLIYFVDKSSIPASTTPKTINI